MIKLKKNIHKMEQHSRCECIGIVGNPVSITGDLIEEHVTAWKVSVFGIFLVRIFPYSDWIRRDASYLSVFSPNAGNAEQKNSEYGQKLAKNSENWLQRIWWIHFGFQIELQYLNERIIRISVSTSYSSDLFRGIIEFYIELYTFLQ